MSNAKNEKFWLLDTAGIVTDSPTYIQNVQVTFKVASAGIVELAQLNREDGQTSTFCYAATLGAASAANDQLTQIIPIENWVQGVTLVTITNVAKLIINTK